MLSQFPKMVVAGTDLGPGIGDANQRLRKVFVFQSRGTKHSSRRGALRAVCQRGTARFQRAMGHSSVPPGIFPMADNREAFTPSFHRKIPQTSFQLHHTRSPAEIPAGRYANPAWRFGTQLSPKRYLA